VPRRDVGFDGKLQLAELAAQAPVTQLQADGRGEGRIHSPKIAQPFCSAMPWEVIDLHLPVSRRRLVWVPPDRAAGAELVAAGTTATATAATIAIGPGPEATPLP